MPYQSLTLNNFTGGEVSDKVYSRTDTQNYNTYAETIQNFVVQPQGGLASRDGFAYVGEVKDSSKSTRLIPYVYNVDNAYIIEMGDQYLRFYRDGGQILENDKTITNITQANPAVVTSAGHGYSNGDHVYISEVKGMTQLNGRRFTVANVAANTFELSGINSTSYTAYSSAGVANKVYTLVSPYTEAQIWDVDFTQSGNTMYFVHPDVQPKSLTRTTDTSWAIANLLTLNKPLLDENTTAITLTLGATSGSTSLTASSSLFASTDVGRYVSWYDGVSFFDLLITAYTSATVVTVTVTGTTAVTTATTRWKLGAFSDTTGYPSCIGLHEQRLYLASTEYQPDTFWASAVGDYVDFAAGTNDADSFSGTLASEKINQIRWLSSTQGGLLLGTIGDIFLLSSSDSTSGITPGSAVASRISTDGSSNVKPVIVGQSTIYTSRTTKRVLELNYTSSNGFGSSNLSTLADHLVTNNIVEMAYQEEPNTIIWMIDNVGQLKGLTFNRTSGIVAWTSHEIGAASGTTGGLINSIACIPTDTQNQLWAIVERTIGGTTKQYVEYMADHFFNDRSLRVQDAKYLDSYLTTTGTTPSATLTPAATTGSAIVFTAGSSVFTANDVGKYLRTTYENADGSFTYSKAIIVGYSSGTSITADIITDFENTSAIASGSWTISSDTVSGLWHLEGQTVQVFADGGQHQDCTVSSGSITLIDQYTYVTVGYGYDQIYQSLELNTASPIGSSVGAKQRVTKIILKMARSAGGKLGRDETDIDTILYSIPVGGEAIPLYSGKKELRPKHNFHEDCKVTIRQEQPLPLNITGCTMKIEINDIP